MIRALNAQHEVEKVTYCSDMTNNDDLCHFICILRFYKKDSSKPFYISLN